MTDPVLVAALNGLALSAALIVAIGAQNAFVLRQGLLRRHVGPVVLFCATADAILIAAGVAGIGSLLERLPGLAPALTLGGAAFLLWYGAGALRRALRPGVLVAGPADADGTLAATLARTAAFTLLNPHVYLDTVLLVGSVGAAQPEGTRVAFVAGAAVASALWFAALGFGARLLAPLFARRAAWRVLDGAVGATMLALAGGLLLRTLR
ncbi:MAG: LysE/ArgO family amino acid transporter [Rhodospirillales bacterium]|jgi:L-lysine exporter family protein LysE/ArgO